MATKPSGSGWTERDESNGGNDVKIEASEREAKTVSTHRSEKRRMVVGLQGLVNLRPTTTMDKVAAKDKGGLKGIGPQKIDKLTGIGSQKINELKARSKTSTARSGGIDWRK